MSRLIVFLIVLIIYGTVALENYLPEVLSNSLMYIVTIGGHVAPIGSFGALGVVLTFLTYCSDNKYKKLEREQKTFSWSHIITGVRDLAKKTKEFNPDVILSLSGPGAIVANLLMVESSNYLPMFLGLSERKSAQQSFSKDIPYEHFIETTRWKTYLPDSFLMLNDKKVLICDDCVISGDTLHLIINKLITCGFKKENIMTASLFVTHVALDTNKGPDKYWFEVVNSKFYLPWGSTSDKGY